MSKKYIAEFEVKGTGRFPVDMLRYDRCFPLTEADSGIISRSVEGHTGGSCITVKIGAFTETQAWTPTYGRWNSFVWAADKPTFRKLS